VALIDHNAGIARRHHPSASYLWHRTDHDEPVWQGQVRLALFPASARTPIWRGAVCRRHPRST
jgi:hypothetical protein